MLHDEQAEQARPRISEPVQCGIVEIFPFVWRIYIRDVELHIDNVEALDQIHLENLEPILNLQRFQILSNDPARLARRIDEVDICGAPADGFDADGAHPRTPIEKGCALYAGPKDVEHRLLELIARWPDARRRRAFEAPAFEFPRNHTHMRISRKKTQT